MPNCMIIDNIQFVRYNFLLLIAGNSLFLVRLVQLIFILFSVIRNLINLFSSHKMCYTVLDMGTEEETRTEENTDTRPGLVSEFEKSILFRRYFIENFLNF